MSCMCTSVNTGRPVKHESLVFSLAGLYMPGEKGPSHLRLARFPRPLLGRQYPLARDRTGERFAGAGKRYEERVAGLMFCCALEPNEGIPQHLVIELQRPTERVTGRLPERRGAL